MKKNLIVYFLIALIGGILGSLLFFQFLPVNTVNAMPVKTNVDIMVKNSPIVEVVKKVKPAVVNIDTKTYVKVTPFGGDFNEIFKHFLGDKFQTPQEPEQLIPQSGLGSGVIISSDGYILTNEHVVHKANEINVTLADKRKFKGKLTGYDKTLDLAIVKIDAKNLPYAELGDSDLLQVGEWVIAIGNPYGIGQTVTVGVLSAKGKEIYDETKTYENLLQTDAAINRGNSGGPLIDIEGKVIGINTAIIPFAQGIGFAIPINTAKTIKGDLITHHKVIRTYLGIKMQDVDEEIAKYFELEEAEGTLVVYVYPNSPADGKLYRGDIILEIEHQKIKESKELRKIIQNRKPGDKISLAVWRKGALRYINITLKEMPEDIE